PVVSRPARSHAAPRAAVVRTGRRYETRFVLPPESGALGEIPALPAQVGGAIRYSRPATSAADGHWSTSRGAKYAISARNPLTLCSWSRRQIRGDMNRSGAGRSKPILIPRNSRLRTKSSPVQLFRSTHTSEISAKPAVVHTGQRYCPSRSGSNGLMPKLVGGTVRTGGEVSNIWNHRVRGFDRPTCSTGRSSRPVAPTCCSRPATDRKSVVDGPDLLAEGIGGIHHHLAYRPTQRLTRIRIPVDGRQLLGYPKLRNRSAH